VVTDVKRFQIYAHEVLQAPKTQFWGCLGSGACTERRPQTPQFWATGVISGASQHGGMCLLSVSFDERRRPAVGALRPPEDSEIFTMSDVGADVS